jgi:transposase
MARRGKRTVFDSDAIARARAVFDKLSYGDEVLAATSVLLAGVLKLSGEQIGSILGVSVATVVRMNKRFRDSGTAAHGKWGGLRNQAVPREIEGELMAGLEASAAEGRIVSAAQVRAVVEAKRGKAVSLQTAYNILKRHGWRKVVPDKSHPKGDKEARENFKKTQSSHSVVKTAMPSSFLRLLVSDFSKTHSGNFSKSNSYRMLSHGSRFRV